MDAAGSQRAALVGVSEGAPTSVVFAASHPGRVSALVLYGGLARALWAPDYPFGVPERTYRREVEEDAETFMTPGELEALARNGFPSADQEEVRAWVRIARNGASPATWEALDRMNMSIDVREVLPVVSAPTLVLRQRGDPWVRAEHCRYLAEHIPGAVLAELDGDGHIPTAAAARQILAQMIPFVRDDTGGTRAGQGAGDHLVLRYRRVHGPGSRTRRHAMAAAADRAPCAGPPATSPSFR